MSGELPGGRSTMTRTGRDGKCAAARARADAGNDRGAGSQVEEFATENFHFDLHPSFRIDAQRRFPPK